MLWKQKDQDTRLFEKRRTETCAETNTKVDTSIFKERTPDLAQIGTLGKIGGGRIQIFCYEKKKANKTRCVQLFSEDGPNMTKY